MLEIVCEKCGKPTILVKTLAGKEIPCEAATHYFVADMVHGKESFVTQSGVQMKGRRVDPGTKNSVAGYIPHQEVCGAEQNATPSETASTKRSFNFKELQELMKSREPILYPDDRSHEDIEYSYISAIIVRYNTDTKKFNLMVELMGKSGHDIMIANPERLKRKEG